MKLKPNDPVPFIYAYFKSLSDGESKPKPLSDYEISLAKNLHKKFEYLKSQLNDENS